MVTILVGADICPIERNRPHFESGNAEALFNDLLPVLRESDFTIANLECPLIDRSTPILKTGPTFGESPRCVRGLVASHIHAVGLANNHIMDHGAEGLASTLRACAEAGIRTVGAGDNLESARKPLVLEIKGVRIAVMAMAEREFSIAGRDKPGANPIDLIATVRTLTEIRSQFDYLIVLYHGSDEFFVPTPRVQETCRFLVELGANAVFVQHPHVVGGLEHYRGGHIVYGQGALSMDEAVYRNQKSFHEGFLARLRIAKDASSSLEIVPFQQSTSLPGTRRMPKELESVFLRQIDSRSASVSDPLWVAKEWNSFCMSQQHDYLSTLLGYGRILSRINRSGLLQRLLYRRITLLRVRNVISCETHREALQTIFANDTGF
jgi:poly-gamma-glutamate capsule biosynthesis protein CapA/YwtB (metallophosphatase superfamily)